MVIALLVATIAGFVSAQEPAASVTSERRPFLRVYRDGAPGVVSPRAIRTLQPAYTAEAMRERVQGVVEIEITVGADGRVLDALVTESLDAARGLDGSAVTAVSQWIFEPGSFDGQAVPVRTDVTLSFRLH